MTRSFRIPALIDLVLVDQFDDLAALNAAPRVDRGFAVHGPLINRLLRTRFSRHAVHRGRPLPALLSRDAEGRPEARAALAHRLSSLTDEQIAGDPDIPPLADFVAGRRRASMEIGPHVQAILVRLFNPGLTADPNLWRAACRLQAFLQAPPVLGLRHRLFWRLKRAIADLDRAVDGQPDGVHAAGIAVHSVVASLRTMRTLALDPASQPRLGEASIVLQCVVPPKRLPREVTAPLQFPCRHNPVTPAALIFADLRRIFERHGDVGAAFQTGSWAECPASHYAPKLLRVIWAAAQEKAT